MSKLASCVFLRILAYAAGSVGVPAGEGEVQASGEAIQANFAGEKCVLGGTTAAAAKICICICTA